ncbi:alginate export family protein [Bordetella tumulicola]|uniref:alginate export family protein n=1 Tax=Bordetella tumulicola TaxID=1649133 RepID=UPI0039EDFDB9
MRADIGPYIKELRAALLLRLIFLLLLPLPILAANDVRPTFEKTRYDEDWSLMRDPAQRIDFLDRSKFIALNTEGTNWLSLGGEARWHYDYIDNPGWGDDPQDPHGVLLERYLLHADLHLGRRLRVFGQLYSARENGRTGAPAPIDENRLDMQQAFADVVLGDGDNAAPMLRIGRQEMAYGSSRLIDVREGPNVRRSFEGARLLTQAGAWRTDVIAVRPVLAQVGNFDDKRDPDQALWGIYASNPALTQLPWGSGLDLYYLGYRHRSASFDQGTAAEQRHTIGARLWGDRGGWDWNWEFIGQGGRFGQGHIAAWSLSAETGHTWPEAKGLPRVGLSVNAASGDKDPNDDDLQSFNALFPRGNYFSELALLGPRNFVNLRPSISFQPARSVTMTADVDFFWRLETQDGIYSPSGGLLRSGQGSGARFVGTELSLSTAWNINSRWTLTAIYSRFISGRFIRETGSSSDIEYVELTLQAKF